MSIPLGLLMKVCIVFIVLTFTTSLACGSGGYYDGNPSPDDWETFLNNSRNDTLNVLDLDETLIVNLTGVRDPVEQNIKTAWRGWKPSEATQTEWKEWHEDWLEKNAKNGEVPWKQKKKKKGEGEVEGPGRPGGPEDPGAPGGDGPGGQDFSAERGPGSGWPNLPGWADLGAGSDGAPIPPWAYVPKNVGKPSICYLAPIKGTCKSSDTDKKPGQRWGYNPYIDECQQYEWSGCGGTRNKFTTRQKCEQHCTLPPAPICSADSGILGKYSKP